MTPDEFDPNKIEEDTKKAVKLVKWLVKRLRDKQDPVTKLVLLDVILLSFLNPLFLQKPLQLFLPSFELPD